ncbi:universal stress protein [Streptomyces sp. NPDC020883]|uniref:universal stress protein n=1 Tax=Streptomyces sp. NPDC020883 TaxID=3365099 RepID=UPI0037A2177A
MIHDSSHPFGEPGRVVVGVTGSPSSEAALRRAVQEARCSGRALLAVLAWEAPGGEVASRIAPQPSLAALWERQARDRLDAAIRSALGGLPDIPVDPAVVRAPAVYALNALADQPGDLLVLGAGPRHPLARLLRGRVRRRVMARAASPVLLVPPPVLPRAIRRRLRQATVADFVSPEGTGSAC